MTVSERTYIQLKKDLDESRILTEGNRLMTEPELSRRYKVAVGTLRKAIARLEEEGIVERQHGRGTFLLNGAAPSSRSNGLTYSISYRLCFQEEVNAVLFADGLRQLDYPQASRLAPLREEAFQADMVFASKVSVYRHAMDHCFTPVPARLAQRLENDYDPGILGCFRSPSTGELLAIPVISNPSPFFINTRIFREQNIPLPSHDWTWSDFLEIARRLKKADILPFLYLTPSGHFFEPFFRQAGGHFFDFYGEPVFEMEAFEHMNRFLQILFQERLLANGLAGELSHLQMLSSGKVAMTICAPHIAMRLPAEQRAEWSYWELMRDRGEGGVCTCFGIAVPTAGNSVAAWEYLEEMYLNRMSGLAEVGGIFPARKADQLAWSGSGMQNPQVVLRELNRAIPKPYKNSAFDFALWYLRMLNDPDDLEKTHRKMIKSLRANNITMNTRGICYA